MPYVSSIENEDIEYGLAAAWVQKDNILTLAQLSEVKSLREVIPPKVNIGANNSEGDYLHGSDIARTELGADGAGVSIGIISDGVDSINDAIYYGELPSGVTVLSNAYGGDEGTAMLEIVHDLAPNANLYFHDCGETVLDFNDAISALVAAGCDIICDDVAWIFEPYFEDGVIASHIEQVIDSTGVIYVSSAGNYAQEHFQGQFYNDGRGFSDFSYGTDPEVKGILMSINPGESVEIVMQWDDPFGRSANDYDLCMFDIVSDSLVAVSEFEQNGDDDPIEMISVVNTSSWFLFVEIKAFAYNAPQNKTLEIFCYEGEFAPGSSYPSTADTIFGQAAVPEVLAVGAVHFDDGLIAEYSSRGPVTTIEGVRQKPDVCGISGVAISGAGGFGSWYSGVTRFYGTSAAAPHIAAVAAQIKSRFPWLSNAEVKQLLLDTCVDMGSPGFDYAYGNGLADTYAACLTNLFAEFETFGGSTVITQAFEYGQKISEPHQPTRAEFYFGGWYKEEECINRYNFDDIPITDTVIYAKWIAEPLDVIFNSMGGSAVVTQLVNEGEKAAEPEEPIKPAYVIEGWYKEEECVNRWNFDTDLVTADITLYAKWIDALTVDFDTGEGNAIESQYLLAGEKAVRPQDPTREGYYFLGWSTDPQSGVSWNFSIDIVTEDITLYALWTSIDPFTVTFDSMGGSEIESQQVVDRGKVTSPDTPLKDGFKFDAWYKEEECQNKWNFNSDIVRSDLTLYAKWLPAYKIVFDSSGGSVVEEQLIFAGEKAIEPDNPTKTDCFFAGWYAEPSYENLWDFDTDIPTSNVTLYARWLDIYDGSGTEADPCLIETAEELWLLGRLVNAGDEDFMDKHYRQTTDINLSVYENWTPIGNSYNNRLTGNYDGGGFTISGMSIDIISEENEIAVGLFGYMDGVLKNLNMTDSNINVVCTGSPNTGSLIGWQKYGQIIACSSTATITATGNAEEGYTLTGGIVGYVQFECLISDCSYSGKILSDAYRSRCGGIVGAMFSECIVENSYNTGIIYGHGSYVHTGGIAGWSAFWDDNNIIRECYNTGDITSFTISSSTYSSSAGIIGFLGLTNASDCFNLGNISSEPYEIGYINNAGGIAGLRFYDGGLLKNCYNTGTVKASYRFGAIGGDFRGSSDESIGCYYLEGCCENDIGFGVGAATSLTLEQLKQQASFIEFDFTNVWEILEGEMSPVLQDTPYAYVEGVSIGDTFVLDVGESSTIEPVFSPANSSNRHVSWQSSDEAVATVSTDGEVTLLTNGTATITATTQEGEISDTCVVSKKIHLGSIELDKTSIELMAGDAELITAALSPEEAHDKSILWTSSNESVALVSEGFVSAVGGGMATITATTTDGGLTAQCTVHVTQLASSVELNQEALALYEGDLGTLTATVLPVDATNKSVTWESSDESVATVVGGVVTAVSYGSAAITITTVNGGYTDVCNITVNMHVTGVSLDRTSINLKPGETDTLSANVFPEEAANKGVIWLSTDKNVASVFNGKVTAISDGVAEIIATTIDGGFSASCFVTVHQPVTGISLEETSLDLFDDDTHQLTVIIEPSNATNQQVIWTSSDTNVATVSNGLVMAKDWGSTTITATTVEGNFKATCEVEVSLRVLTSDVYFVDIAYGYIKDVPINTTPEEFIANFENNPENLSLSCGTEYIATGNTLAQIPDYSAALRVVVLGDTDGNARISITDYTLTRLDILGLKSLNAAYREAADINNDVKISITDYTLIRLDILGLKSIH